MSGAPAENLTRPLLESALLAFVAGFVDCCGYIALFGLFSAHVTGNFITFGAALVASDGTLIAKLLALPVFVLTVATVRLWAIGRVTSAGALGLSLVWAQAGALIGFMLVGIAASPIGQSETPLAILAGMLAVIAMAIQNASARLAFADLAPTTVMTGNVTQSVIDAVDLLFPRLARSRPEVRARFAKMGPAVVGFALGAVLGAFGYARFGFLSLVVPILALAVVAVAIGRVRS